MQIKKVVKIFYLKIIYKIKFWGVKKIVIEIIAYSLLFLIVFTGFVNTFYAKKVENRVYKAYQIDKLVNKEYGIVLGADAKDGLASDILADRVQVGINLLLSGKVQKLLLSGDEKRNEVSAMRKYIEEKLGKQITQHYFDTGILVPDNKSKNTYATCYRAKNTYGISNAFVVTQDFHIVRTLTTCRLIGIESEGITSDLREYSAAWWLKFRDFFAFDKAIIDLKILKPKPETL